jgi:hypothetical protein
MSHRADPAELFDVGVDQLARLVTLIAPGSAGSKAESLFKPSLRRIRLTVAGEISTSAAILLARAALPAQNLDRGPCGHWV